MSKELVIKEEFNTLEIRVTNEDTLYIDIERVDPDDIYPDRYSWIEIPMNKIKDLKEFINSL